MSKLEEIYGYFRASLLRGNSTYTHVSFPNELSNRELDDLNRQLQADGWIVRHVGCQIRATHPGIDLVGAKRLYDSSIVMPNADVLERVNAAIGKACGEMEAEAVIDKLSRQQAVRLAKYLEIRDFKVYVLNDWTTDEDLFKLSVGGWA